MAGEDGQMERKASISGRDPHWGSWESGGSGHASGSNRCCLLKVKLPGLGLE